MSEKIRLFVGTPANNEDLECQAVFDWSLRKFHPNPDDIEVTWMMLSRDPNSFWYSDPQKKQGWNTKTWATPFSPLRWGIPAACNYTGKAIYHDCDQIFLADVADLWNQEIPDTKALLMSSIKASCTMLMDCAKMRVIVPNIDKLKKIEGRYREIRGALVQNAAGVFQGDWNCLDGKGHKTIYDGDVKVLHYTHIPTQPNHRHARLRLKAEGRAHWYNGEDREHSNKEVPELFDKMLAEAVAAGRGPETFRVAPEFGDYGR